MIMADNMTAPAAGGKKPNKKDLADSLRESIERDKEKLAQQPTGKGDLLPTHYFAPEIQSLITSLAASLQTPRDFITASLMTVYGVALGANIEVFIDGQYHNKPNLWTFLCAEPTANKTAAMKSLIAPLLDMQTQYDADYKDAYAEWKRAKKNGDGEKEEPTPPYLVGSSATLEKQILILSQQPKGRGFLRYENEAGSFIEGWGRYSSGNSMELNAYINMHDGEYVSTDGIGRGKVSASGYCMSFLGSMQPQRIPQIFKNPISFLGSGFLQRVLVVMPPEQLPIYPSPAPPTKELGEWECHLRAAMEKQECSHLLAADAQSLYDDFRNYTVRQDKYDAPIQQMYRKQHISITKVALLFHYLHNPQETPSKEIPAKCMEVAIEAMKGFAKYWIKMYNTLMSGTKQRPKYGELILLARQSIKERCEQAGEQPPSDAELARFFHVSPPYVAKLLKNSH